MLILILLVVLGIVVYALLRSNSNKSTLKDTLSDIVPEKYVPKEEDSLFVSFYSKLMEQAYKTFKLDSFEYLFAYILLEELKEDEDDLDTLTDFYRTNRHYDFNDFDIKRDQKNLFSHNEDIAARVQLFITIRPFLQYREKLLKIRVSDIDNLYKKNEQAFQQVKAIYDDSQKRNMTDFISKSRTVMNTIRIENKFLSYAKEILKTKPV